MALKQINVVPAAPIKRILVGSDNKREISANEKPLAVFSDVISQDFLSYEVGFRETVGDTFYTGDLAKLWSNPRLLKAVLHQPLALFDLRAVARRTGVKIEPVKVTEALQCLGITQDFLWDKNIETIEELISHFSDIDDELVKQDLNSAFLSQYGINLMSAVLSPAC